MGVWDGALGRAQGAGPEDVSGPALPPAGLWGLRFLIYDMGATTPPGLLQSFGEKYLKAPGSVNCYMLK